MVEDQECMMMQIQNLIIMVGVLRLMDIARFYGGYRQRIIIQSIGIHPVQHVFIQDIGGENVHGHKH